MDEELATFGSGNVFADLGVPNPEEHLAKSRLVAKITDVIRERRLTQMEAAALTGVPQPKISGLMRGQFRDFSSDRLCRMLNKLGVGVELVLVNQPEWQTGTTTVSEPDEIENEMAPAMAKRWLGLSEQVLGFAKWISAFGYAAAWIGVSVGK